MSEKKVIVIGAGFAGLSSACFLAKSGYAVQVFEKHPTPGGRARRYETDGFVFDMGPSWYWMPDVFERFFAQFDEKVSTYYSLKKLSPAYSVIFGKNDIIDIPSDINDVYTLFESIEHGSAARLRKFLAEAQFKYEVAMQDLVYKPGLSWSEFMDSRIISSVFRLGMMQSYAAHVRKYFSDERLIRIMEFPVLFLGGAPRNIPALYSLMAYAGLSLGTWYPEGGMYRIVEAMHKLAIKLGVEFHFEEEVTALHTTGSRITYVETSQGRYPAGHVVAAGDYHHIEHDLLDESNRLYREEYWKQRVMSPSAVIFYLGIDRQVPRLRHHNLFFDAPFDAHVSAIYDKPNVPDKPLFYVCAPSVTDETVAPPGHENLFILVPLSTELKDTESMRDRCFEHVMDRLESFTGLQIRKHIVHNRSYAGRDFIEDYHALRGNAYGLANTLMQTAMLKPKMRSAKVENLVYAGQLTVPGPGVPPALISGEIAAGLISKTNHLQSSPVHAVTTV